MTTPIQTNTHPLMPDPRHTERDAYLVAATPTEYSNAKIVQLFARGYDRYIANDTPDTETLLSDVERFGTAAFEQVRRERALNTSFVDKPATLVLLATVGTICVMEQPRFEDTPLRRIQPIRNIRELFANNLLSLVRESDDPTLYQEIAEVLYRKPPAEDGPHPGRVCTGVKPMPEFGDDSDDEEELYVEIPMVAASRACLARTTTEAGPAATSAENTGEIRTQVANNNLYISIDHFEATYQQYAETGFGQLQAVQEEELGGTERRWLAQNETAITERTDRALKGGHYEQVWTHWDSGERIVRLLRTAVQADPRTQIGEFYTAKELYDALDAYNPADDGERTQLQRFSNHRSVAKTLANHDTHRSVTIDRSGRVNTYRIGHSGSGARPIDVTELEDLFELPCMAAMDDRLQDENPVRKDLFNFVRMAMWLPQYREQSVEEITEDIHNLFSRWPWYDPEITDYQVRYEARRGERGIGPKNTTPLPMGCDNDDMQRYCIGKEQCPYSIYGSLPFPDEMYDELTKSGSWF